MKTVIAFCLIGSLFGSIDPGYRQGAFSTEGFRISAFECKVWDDKDIPTKAKIDLYRFFPVIERTKDPEQLKALWSKYCGFQRSWLRKKGRDGSTLQRHIERTAKRYHIELR